MAFHLKYIRPHQKKLKLGLYHLIDVYLVLMFLRTIIVVAIWVLRDAFGWEEKDLIWFYPLQIDIYQAIVAIFIFVLFKMKKVEIMLNISEKPAEIVIARLHKFLWIHRIFFIIVSIEMLVQIMGAFYFYYDWKEQEKWKIACLSMLIINNILLFFGLSILLFFFIKMGQTFVRYIVENDNSMTYQNLQWKANILLGLLSFFLLFSYFYNYVIYSIPLMDDANNYERKLKDPNWVESDRWQFMKKLIDYPAFKIILTVFGIIESFMPLMLGLFIMVVLKYFGENSGATGDKDSEE